MGIWTYKNGKFSKQELYRYLSLDYCPYCQNRVELLFQDAKEEVRLQTMIHSERIEVHICKVCGWWKARRDKDVEGPTVVDNTKVATPKHLITKNAAVGSLRSLNLNNISTPINEIRAYLTARYDDRFSLNPRLFEETVASVFKDHKYDVKVTGYSNDGGIDIILNKENEEIGVQVKRYKNKIKVEQIRSLVGALLLRGITKGMFVTTSDFQRGVTETAKKFEKHGYKIELMNAEHFYGALKITQRLNYSSKDEFLAVNDLSNMYQLSVRDVI